jgi:hypothetical protein
MSNELSGASICSGLMKKSPVETSFFLGKVILKLVLQKTHG